MHQLRGGFHSHTHGVGGLRDEKFELGPNVRAKTLFLFIQHIRFFLNVRKYVNICL